MHYDRMLYYMCEYVALYNTAERVVDGGGETCGGQKLRVDAVLLQGMTNHGNSNLL